MRRSERAAAVAALIIMAACGDDDNPSLGPAPTTTQVASECQQVAFTPDSEDVAADIRAYGLSCEEAEAVVRTAGPTLSAQDGPASHEVNDFRCVRTSATQEPIPTATYECTSGSKRITFVRT